MAPQRGFLGRTLRIVRRPEGRQRRPYASAIYRDLSMAYESTLALSKRKASIATPSAAAVSSRRHRKARYAGLDASSAGMKAILGLPYTMLPRARMREEMATDLYDGGAVIPDLGSLQLGLYHRGLMERVLSAGVEILGNCEVTAMRAGARHHDRRRDTRA